MQAALVLQPPPLLAIANKVNLNHPRVPQHFSFQDISSLIHIPLPMTLEKDHRYSSQSGTNYTTYVPPFNTDSHSPAMDHTLYQPQQPNNSQSSSSKYTPSIKHTTTTTTTTTNTNTTSPSISSSPHNSGTRTPYVSTSPSPVDHHPTPSFPQPYSAPHHQHHFPSSATSYPPPDLGRYPISSNLRSRGTDKYAHSLHDQRRMSEPAIFGSAIGGYSTTSSADSASARYQQLHNQYTASYTSPRLYPNYTSSLQRTLSTDSVRDHSSQSPWKHQDHLPLHSYDPLDLEDPISPRNSTLSVPEGSPTPAFLGMPYGSLSEDYGPSPPGTATSTSSNPPDNLRRFLDASGSSSDSKQYSFVALPGNAVKKRPRRRYDEIERLYQCSWPTCTKAYGTLNHLNAHVTMQKHGPKRSPNEFKELRKQWRKTKKEESDARTAAMGRSTHHQYLPRGMHDSFPDVDYHVRSHPHQGAHLDRFTSPIASPEELQEIDMQEVYERRQQRFNGLFPSAARTSSPTYTATQQPPHMPSSHSAMNRLPTNSTLLTPLPGYERAGSGGHLDAYPSYSVYDENRPSSGHGSMGSYDEKRRSGAYDEKQS